MIELSVALPLYKSKEIAWLALEGLCRQTGICFEWELLIAEELNEDPFGAERIKEYLPRLEKAGCKRFDYVELNEWEALSEKWYRLAQMVSPTSHGFVLQAADCFDYPERLFETHQLFKFARADWVQASRGVFYNIPSGRSAMFKRTNNILYHPCGLNMAISTRLTKKIKPGYNVRSSVDSWLYQQTEPEKVCYLHFSKVVNGFDSDGFNNISKARATKIKTNFPPFERTDWKIREHIPAEIVDRLEEMRDPEEQPEADLGKNTSGKINLKKEEYPSITICVIRSREEKFRRAYQSYLRLIYLGKLEIRVFDNRELKYSNGKCRNILVKESTSDRIIFMDDDDTASRGILIEMMEALFQERNTGKEPACICCYRTLIYELEPERIPERHEMLSPGLWKRNYLLKYPFDEKLERWIPYNHMRAANERGVLPIVATWSYSYFYHLHNSNMSKQETGEIDEI